MNEMPYRPPLDDSRADEIAGLVREIAANRRALLPHRSAFDGLDRTVKDPWKTGPMELNEAALVAELPPGQTVSLRLDPAFDVDIVTAAPARVSRGGPGLLLFRRGRVEIGRIAGPSERLDLLEQVLGGRADEHVADTLLPKDVSAFASLADERRDLVRLLLENGRELVERVERLVCALYEVPDALTEEVMKHASERAIRST